MVLYSTVFMFCLCLFWCVCVLGVCSVKGLGSWPSRSPSTFWCFTFFSGSISMCCRGCVLSVLLFCSFRALPLLASCPWIRIWLLGCCYSKELGVQMLRVDGVFVCCTLSLPDCSIVGGCRSFTIDPPSSQLPNCSSSQGLWWFVVV